MTGEAVHVDPVWRGRSDFIIAAAIDGGDLADPALRTEQLWARRVDASRFEICCIPFFIYDLSLGDEVVVDDDYLVGRVVQTSGRYVFRAYFERADDRLGVADVLKSMGAQLELYSHHLLAIDCPDEAGAQTVANYLQEQEDAMILQYETGRLSS